MLAAHDLEPDTLRPLRRVEYDRLVALGVFDEDERVELLYGHLVTMSPRRDDHAFAVEELTERLVVALTGRARVRTQLPFAASDKSEPEPDLVVIPPRMGSTAHPSTVLLVIEVSDTSLKKDRTVKGPLYAEAGVPEYWTVNLVERRVELHRSPAAGRYGAVTHVGDDGVVAPEAFPDVVIPVAALLPPPA